MNLEEVKQNNRILSRAGRGDGAISGKLAFHYLREGGDFFSCGKSVASPNNQICPPTSLLRLGKSRP
jgi:hypothetical protein